MKKIVLPLLMLCFLGFSGCQKHEIIFDHPFVYITTNPDLTSSTDVVDCQARVQRTYYIVLSSKTLDEELVVNYDLVPENGLTENEDYQLLSARSVVFSVGLYVIPIRIQWLPKQVDPTKLNTLKIVLTNNSMNFTMGFPGPEKNNSVFTITKY